jgi:hypothetical protein
MLETSIGYRALTPEDLIRMHRRGVTPDFIRSEKARRGARLTPGDLVYARTRGN